MPLDTTELLEHLRTKAAQYSRLLVTAAVLDGLITAIVRGDFDQKEEN